MKHAAPRLVFLLSFRQVSSENLASSTMPRNTNYTTFDPLNFLLRARSVKTFVFWSIILVVVITASIASTVLLLLKYWAKEKTVVTKIVDGSNDFPSITICNLNPYKRSMLPTMPNVEKLIQAFEENSRSSPPAANPTLDDNLAPEASEAPPANHQRVKRALPDASNCSCNDSKPILYNTTTNWAYVGYPCSKVSWPCAFACCKEFNNGTLASYMESEFFKSPATIDEIYWIGLRCVPEGKSLGYHWYANASTKLHPVLQPSNVSALDGSPRGINVCIKSSSGSCIVTRKNEKSTSSPFYIYFGTDIETFGVLCMYPSGSSSIPVTSPVTKPGSVRDWCDPPTSTTASSKSARGNSRSTGGTSKSSSRTHRGSSSTVSTAHWSKSTSTSTSTSTVSGTSSSSTAAHLSSITVNTTDSSKSMSTNRRTSTARKTPTSTAAYSISRVSTLAHRSSTVSTAERTIAATSKSSTHGTSSTASSSSSTVSTSTSTPDKTDSSEAESEPAKTSTNSTLFDDDISLAIKQALLEVTTDENALGATAEDLLPYLTGIYSPEVLKAASYMARETIVRCKFNGVHCTYKNFTLYQDNSFGNCYTFDAPQRVRAFSSAGASGGFALAYLVESSEYLYIIQSLGVRLVIHERNGAVLPEVFGLNVLSEGYTTSVALRRQRVKGKSTPRKPCVKNSDQIDQYLYTGVYTPEACLKSCHQRMVIARCGCGDPRLPLPPGNGNVTLCDIFARDCVNTFYVGFEHECNCPPACDGEAYESTVSTRRPSRLHMSNQGQSSTKSTARDYVGDISQLALIEVYLETPTILQHSEQLQYDLMSVWTDWSSIVGLISGGSVITVFEIINIWLYCQEKNKRK